jgi:hypothetical protein
MPLGATGLVDLPQASVFRDDDLPDGALPPPAEPPDNQLARLREKMEKAREKAIAQTVEFRLPVPRMEDTFVVAYAPLDLKLLNKIADKFRGEKDKSFLDIQIEVLIQHCRGVYVIDDDGEAQSANVGTFDGRPPKFDKDLADSLGIQYVSSVHTLRALYQTDLDIGSVYDALADVSGSGKALEIAEAARGN